MNRARNKLAQRLSSVLSREEILVDAASLEAHSGDKWFEKSLPDVVALPRSTESVAALLRYANQHRIPVTARGGGYGYVGGCVPVKGGIVLSLERIKRIREISADDFVADGENRGNNPRLERSGGEKRHVLPARSAHARWLIFR